jgi:hypothetical protein
MVMRIPLSFLVSLAALAVLSGAARADAQASDDLFAEAGVQDLQLLVNSSDLALLRQDYTTNTYYPADVEYRGVRVRNVGIRSRGLGSRSATKLGLRVDMNRFSSGQRFFGETAVVLDNLWQDATLVRERLAMAMFERAGIAAPREVFVRLFVNGTYEGLYALTEEVNTQFLERTGAAGDVLFEFKWVTEYRAEDLGADPAAYVPLFGHVPTRATRCRCCTAHCASCCTTRRHSRARPGGRTSSRAWTCVSCCPTSPSRASSPTPTGCSATRG